MSDNLPEDFVEKLTTYREPTPRKEVLFDGRIHIERKDVAREMFDELKLLRFAMVGLGVMPFFAMGGLFAGSFLVGGAVCIISMLIGGYYFSIMNKKYRYLGEKYKFLAPVVQQQQSTRTV